MSLALVQFREASGERGVAAIRDMGQALRIPGASTTLALAHAAAALGVPLGKHVDAQRRGSPVDLPTVQLLAPIDHEDPAHLLLSGTGLTHLGSAEERDRMHRQMSAATQQSDSMRMFLMGVKGGKPTAGPGVQPEWFYKGDGSSLVAPGALLPVPDFALDAGEEPELAGIYLIARDGTPRRLGFALANEFSDHVTERENYLWLAHSKLRPAALGPELLVSELPGSIIGTSRILRAGAVLWERAFCSGEEHMSHSIANLEYHHFKYASFRRPGDVHVHFFGTGTLSFADGFRSEPGDIFEISAPPFSLPVRNPLGSLATPPINVRPL